MVSYRALKRGLDIVAAGLFLLLLLPLFLIIVTGVALDLGRPVFFRQFRGGLHGSVFQIIKFRTMRDARGPDGQLLPDTQRLTRFGSFLRRSSLDELPELWNVLLGDMSLVGPRPLIADYLALYSPQQARRHDVRPGLTGLAQIKGRNSLTWKHRFWYDVWYVDNCSLQLDLSILCITSKDVVFGRRTGEIGPDREGRFLGNQFKQS
jgi:sugar transferase EpsL